MLWSPAILLLLVGATFANQQNGWKEGREYTYKVRSRTLSSYNQQSKQFAGIVMQARLTVQPNGPETLRAKITNPRYAQLHTRLEKGWDSEIPQDQVNLQSFPLSDQPFEIRTKNGVVRDLIVDKNLPTWEVNILKSIVSQLQVDTKGENAQESKHNQLPEGEQPFALFKVMEDSVGGKCEVLYDISPLPQHVHQNKPELVPMPELQEEGDIISLVKTKNYSNCEQRISYHYGLNGRNKWEPGSNGDWKHLSRSSVSRVIISGTLRKYTIQSSVTTNKVVFNPDQQETQQGMVASKMNLTLREVKDISDPIPSPADPQSTGNLVYNYNNPFERPSSRRPNKINHRPRNTNDNRNSKENVYDSNDSVEENDGDSYLQPKPKLTEAPRSPLLPYFIGNRGNTLQQDNKVNIVKAAKNIAQEIGNDMQNPDKMPDEETLEKFVILSRLIRTMNVQQIADVQTEVFEPRDSQNQLDRANKEQKSRRSAWIAFRDAVAQAGTGPALVNIKKWIENKQIQGSEAAEVVDAVGKSARTPTVEYMDEFLELVKLQETKKQRTLRDAAVLTFADLIRHAIVNKRSAHNRYPVHAFGRLFDHESRHAQEKYIPYMAEELNSAIESGDSTKIQVYTAALGRTAHPQMLSVFEPYLEGRKQVSPYQRFLMVASMYKLATSSPKVARSVLYKIYSNNADYHEIRTIAVYLLMKTNPPASMLQRMADYTNYDSSKHVNSAVKSTIESLAKLDNSENRELVNAAKAALPLLNTEKYGPQYSRAIFKNYKNEQTGSNLVIEANYIGGDDSIIPKGVHLSIAPSYKGLKVPKIQLGGYVSSVQDVLKFLDQKLSANKKYSRSSQDEQEKESSPENIARLLGIRGDEPQQTEGFMFLTERNGNYLFTFDNHTLERIPEHLKELDKTMKNGVTFEETKISNYEIIISFPMETGYPLTFSIRNPTIMSLTGKAKSKAEFDTNGSPIPKSANVSGKLRVIYGMKLQKRLGFVAPFEHQEYVAGLDANVQVHLPVQSELSYDENKKEARVKVQPNDEEDEYKILQYKLQPFTSKHDLMSLRPIASDKNTHVIDKRRVTPSKLELNGLKNKQRVKFEWERVSDRVNQESELNKKTDNAMEAATKLIRSVSSLYIPIESSEKEYEKYTVKVFPDSDMSAEVKVSYDSLLTDNESVNNEDWEPNAKVQHLEKSLNSQERKQKLLKQVSKNINSANANAVDVTLKVNGDLDTSVSLTAAIANSNVDPRTRVLVYSATKMPIIQDIHLAVAFESKSPEVDSFDYEEILKNNKPRKFDLEVHCGEETDGSSEDDSMKIKIKGVMKQTEERKNQVRQSEDAKACMKQAQKDGNKLTLACEKAKERALYADLANVTVTFDKDSLLKEYTMSALDSLEGMSHNYADKNRDHNDKEEENKIRLGFKLSPNHEKLDITVKTQEGKVEFKNIDLQKDGDESKDSIESTKEQEEIKIRMSQETICSLDKTQTKTFDDRRYPLQLGKCWHVAMTTYPKNDPDRPSQQQEIPNDMRVSILTKENEDELKDLKVTLGDKEIKLLASRPRDIKVKVNGAKIDISRKQQIYQENKDGEIVVEIFELPDKSVKLISDKYDIKIMFDGSRAQIEAGDKYRDSVRGLCGNYDGESSNDQQTPKGCLLQNSEEFTATYALVDNKCEGLAVRNLEKAKKAQCSYELVKPGNVISDQEAGRENQHKRLGEKSDNEEQRSCTHYRTKVTETEREICFSLRPVPTCSSKCKPDGMKQKAIEYHCVPRSNASEKVAERIKNGANPDLSQKKVSITNIQPIPLACKAN